MIRNEREHFTIFGAGSIGSLFAAKLALAGNHVTLFTRKGIARHIRRFGLTLQTNQGSLQNVTVDTQFEFEARFLRSNLIIATKAYDNEAVCNIIKPYLNTKNKSHFKIILLQNGVGNEHIYEQVFQRQNIYRLLTSEASSLLKPGHVVYTGTGKTILVRRDSLSDNYAEWLVEVLTTAGLPCQVSTNFTESIWTKAVINAPINSLGAIYQVKNGQLLQTREILNRFEQIITESINILKMKPIKTILQNPIKEIKDVARNTAENKSSMLQDLERGKPTEIDYINGAIVALAKELKMDATENIQTVKQIKTLELQNRKYGSP